MDLDVWAPTIAAPLNHDDEGEAMSVAKVIEISSTSKSSFEDAVRDGVRKASETVKDIRSGWVSEMKVDVENGEVVKYQVNMRLTFVVG